MFTAETQVFLEGGCALIVGTVDDAGAPLAARGWGVDVTAEGPGDLRVLVDASDEPTLTNLAPGAAIAITGTDVRTYRSVQMKGFCVAVEPGTDADVARAARFCDAFYRDVEIADGTPRALIDRLTPAAFVVCHARVDAQYDQTPGPKAGAPMRAAG